MTAAESMPHGTSQGTPQVMRSSVLLGTPSRRASRIR